MEIKVKEVTDVVQKSKQEIEQELLDKHEKDQSSEETVETANIKVADSESDQEEVKQDTVKEPEAETKEEVQPKESSELKEDDVLSYIGKRYGKEINSIDELISEREEAEPLPEDVAAYFKYKKETGRGLSDYVKLF